MKVRIQRVGNHQLPIPEYQTEGASAFDLRAQLGAARLACPPGVAVSVPVGFAFEVPDGYELQVRGRSGLAFGWGIIACHSPGTVDSDYRGEVRVLLHNMSGVEFVINHGDRIAQGVIAPVVRAQLEEVSELSETARGNGGFGSTGR